MLFVDVDALSKLANWNLLPLVSDILQTPWSKISTISSLRHRAQACLVKPDNKLFHTTHAAQIALDCISKTTTCPIPNSDVLEAFSRVAQIDAGEAVLFSLVMNYPDARLLTGDKRALRALANHEFSSNFDGKIVCLEQVIKLALFEYGREWLLASVSPLAQIDKTIRIVLGSNYDATEEQMHEALDSYIRELKKLKNPPLLWTP